MRQKKKKKEGKKEKKKKKKKKKRGNKDRRKEKKKRKGNWNMIRNGQEQGWKELEEVLDGERSKAQLCE